MKISLAVVAALVSAGAGTAYAAPFSLTSTDIKAGAAIPQKNAGNIMGCTGEGKSPALEWKNPPKDTKSFALMVHDPDAPTGGSGFWHWIVYNIPADATSIPGGGPLPKGAVEGNTDMGKPGYIGPCPPPGTKHHYNFMLYPLKVEKLEIPPGATAAFVGFNANMNSIGKPAKLTATYQRPKEAAPAKAAAEKPAEKPAPAKEMAKPAK